MIMQGPESTFRARVPTALRPQLSPAALCVAPGQTYAMALPHMAPVHHGLLGCTSNCRETCARTTRAAAPAGTSRGAVRTTMVGMITMKTMKYRIRIWKKKKPKFVSRDPSDRCGKASPGGSEMLARAPPWVTPAAAAVTPVQSQLHEHGAVKPTPKPTLSRALRHGAATGASVDRKAYRASVLRINNPGRKGNPVLVHGIAIRRTSVPNVFHGHWICQPANQVSWGCQRC